jgi:hypothetical protein
MLMLFVFFHTNLPSRLPWCFPHMNIPSADKVFSNTINTATATDPITIADDVAIMLDEGEVHPAAVKPVFSNLLLRGGVVPPRNIEDSFGEVEGAGCRVVRVCKAVNAVSKQLLYEASETHFFSHANHYYDYDTYSFQAAVFAVGSLVIRSVCD